MKTSAKNPLVSSLDALLAAWESTCIVYQAKALAYRKKHGQDGGFPLKGPCKNWADLRKDILSSAELDKNKYFAEGKELSILASLALTPYVIHAWTRSGRVFSLSEDTQAMLNATSYGNLKWEDVLFPFDSFAIKLATEMKGVGEQRYDMLVVRKMKGGGMFNYGGAVASWEEEKNLFPPKSVEESTVKFLKEISDDDVVLEVSMISSNVGSLPRVTQQERKELRAKALCGDLQGVEHQVTKISTNWEKARKKQRILIPFFINLGKGDREVSTSIKELRENKEALCMCGGDHPEWLAAIRLIVGTCLQLQSMSRKKKAHWSKAHTIPINEKLLPLALITTEAQVLDITFGARQLTKDEREMYIADKGEEYDDQSLVQNEEKIDGRQVPKWHRGYTRRADGFGNDENAPRCIIVPPTLFNKHRLKPGQLPLGMQQQV